MIDALREILGRADLRGASTYLAHEAARWPLGTLEQLVALGLLRAIGASRTVRCFSCGEHCDVEPEWRDYPTRTKPLGVYMCAHEEYGGRLEFEPERARQWELHFKRLCELVAGGLGACGPVVEVVSSRVGALGTARFDGAARAVFLITGLNWPDAAEVLAEVHRHFTAARAVIFYPAVLPPHEIVEPRRAVFIGLRDFVSGLAASSHVGAEPQLSAAPDSQAALRSGALPDAQSVPVPGPAAPSRSPLRLDLRGLSERVAAFDLRQAPDAVMPAAALTTVEHTVLTALAARPQEAMLLVELEAAAGYGKKALRAALARLVALGYVARPGGTQRKGAAITPTGVAILAAPRATPATSALVAAGN